LLGVFDWAKFVAAELHRRDEFIGSPTEQEVGKKLYNETMIEMSKSVAVPSYLASKA